MKKKPFGIAHPCALVAALVAAGALAPGCGDNGSGTDGDLDSDADADTPGGDADVDSDADAETDSDADGPVVEDGDVDVDDDGESWTCHVTTCAGHTLECGNCEDDDGDGSTDSRDRQCLGPCDNTEGDVLLAGVGGETGGPCRADCYFDFGNGPGYDDCRWDHRCDPFSVAPYYDPEGEGCELDADMVGGRDCPESQSETCLTVCPPLTPNGCDCFGCCTFPALAGRSQSEGGEFVWIGSVIEGTNTGTCTFADVLDRSLCRPCTPVGDCYNDCGPCELCLGRETLPPECFGEGDGGHVDGGTDGGTDGGPPGERCPEGVQPCGLPDDPECAPDYYCITGCCQPILI